MRGVPLEERVGRIVSGGEIPYNRELDDASSGARSRSPSLCDDSDNEEARRGPLACWYHPGVKRNRRVVIFSVILLLFGSVCLLVGIALLIAPHTEVRTFIFFIAGVVCIIPGAYHLIYICLAVHNKKGFSLYRLPTLS